MLADVIKDREQRRQQAIQEEIAKYSKPYKRDTIIYFEHLYKLGGIQTWITNLAQDYEFSVVYDFGDKERIDYLESMGIETIKYVGQPIECDTLLTCIFGNPEKIKAKKTVLVIHGDYKQLPIDIDSIPKHDEVVCVSKLAADSWYEITGEKARVICNPVKIYDATKPLIIGVFSRLSKEKGRNRVKYLAERLIEKNKPFLMLIFSDFKVDIEDKRVIEFDPVMNPHGWMKKCDYVCQLSDTEAAGLTIHEALKMKIPVIVTELPVLKEFGIDKSNAKILKFDMSNLDIDDLWNIPVFNWKEPDSKEWEDYMKKKVFRERYVPEVKLERTKDNTTYEINLQSEEPVKKVETPKKEKKVKKNDRNTNSKWA